MHRSYTRAMPLLCVNVDHVATVRQARRTFEPDPLEAAHEAVARIAAVRTIEPHHQAVIVAVAPDGRVAAAALRKGFLLAVRTAAGARLEPPGATVRDD